MHRKHAISEWPITSAEHRHAPWAMREGAVTGLILLAKAVGSGICA
jgi:hypothetical protein